MNKRDVLIEKLIDFGIFKIKDKQLFELPIDDLEQELKRIMQSKKIR
ncbi:Fur-regulated basic protein FbpA [Robertmurraya massiliosenegalensis]|nr:Fur-regulated basic protein FbpA [Robertmurraya massiliosenegalensis]